MLALLLSCHCPSLSMTRFSSQVQDGYICWNDFDSQMKYMLVSHNHDEKTMEQITALFEDAWRRVLRHLPCMPSLLTRVLRCNNCWNVLLDPNVPLTVVVSDYVGWGGQQHRMALHTPLWGIGLESLAMSLCMGMRNIESCMPMQQTLQV